MQNSFVLLMLLHSVLKLGETYNGPLLLQSDQLKSSGLSQLPLCERSVA